MDAIDFWRGLVLCMIFVNHVPGNLFEKLTAKNFGFSDASEAFVFISGLSLALAYGSRLMRRDDAAILMSLGRRSVKLYAVHILLSLAGLAIFALGANLSGVDDLMAAHGRALFVDDPVSALVGLLSLGHQLGYFNILPLYVLLVAMAPVLFWLARLNRALMLGISFSLYLLARIADLNMPTWPMQGQWFFDPFAWQFLMAIGLAVGLSLREGPPRPSTPLAILAALVVGVGLVCVTSGFALVPGLETWAHRWLDLDKTALGAGRLVHFLAVAYLTFWLGVAGWMRRAAWYGPLAAIGRHGLRSFALLSILAAIGQVLVGVFGHSLRLDLLVILGGLALLVRSAMFDRVPEVGGIVGAAVPARR